MSLMGRWLVKGKGELVNWNAGDSQEVYAFTNEEEYYINFYWIDTSKIYVYEQRNDKFILYVVDSFKEATLLAKELLHRFIREVGYRKLQHLSADKDILGEYKEKV